MKNYELLNYKAITKIETLNNQPVVYWLKSIMAGVYLAICCLTYWKLFELFGANGHTKFIAALMFPLGLSLILITNTELFTSNNMFMFFSILSNKVSVSNSLKLWTVCWFGNFIGNILVAIMAYLTGFYQDSNLNVMEIASQAKANYPLINLFFKAVSANFIVCLAVFAYLQLKDDFAKLFIVFLTISIFLILGFEHSIANMGTFSFHFFNNFANFNLHGALYNIIITTIGNIIGGCLFGWLIFIKESKNK